MKKSLGVFLFICCSLSLTVFGADLAEEYLKVFGTGIILASGKGLPPKAKYDASQFVWKEGRFFLQGGASATVDFRAILPEGTVYRKFLDKIKSEKPDAFKNWAEDLVIWNVWVSHGLNGEEILNVASGSLFEPSKAGKPFFSFATHLEERQVDFNGVAFTWEQNMMKTQLGPWLTVAKPGFKIYVIHSTGFAWTASGASSQGHQHSAEGATLAASEPLASCTIEIQ